MHLFCSHCGTKNSSADTVCLKCNSPIGHVDSATVTEQPTPANYTTSLIVAGVCALYLVFPTLGVFELIPDAMPIIGSLDEAAATTGLWISLSKMGLNPFAK